RACSANCRDSDGGHDIGRETPPRTERRNPALGRPEAGFCCESLEPITTACVCHLADGRGNRPWRVGQTSIGDARNSAWRWRVRLESAKRALPYPTWQRSGCGWRRGNPPSQYSRSNNKFTPRTTIRRSKDPLVANTLPDRSEQNCLGHIHNNKGGRSTEMRRLPAISVGFQSRGSSRQVPLGLPN